MSESAGRIRSRTRPKWIMKLNAATFDITPTSQVDQGAGTAADGVRLSIRNNEPLEVNMLAIWADPDAQPVLMVTLDLLYPGEVIRAAIERAASPLAVDRIVVAASHTHAAPMTDDTKPALGRPDPDYVEWLISQLTPRVRQVLDVSNAVDSQLELGQGQASHSINRRRRVRFLLTRRPRWNIVAIGPNPEGSTDETLIVGAFTDADGVPLAWIWNYACHPVAHPRPRDYSSHYIHHIRQRLRALVDSQVPVLFFQGFSGNTRPAASVGARGWKARIRRIFSGPQFRAMNDREYGKWVGSLAARVVEVASTRGPVSTGAIEVRRLTRPGEDFALGLGRGVSFQMLRFSDDFVLAGVSGEPVAEYAALVREYADSMYTMCVGCIDHVFGYIPTKSMLDEGGYESVDFCEPFSIRAVSPAVEEHVRQSFKSLLSLQLDA